MAVARSWKAREDRTHVDPLCPGLYFNAANGPWSFRYQIRGKRRQPSLNSFPELTRGRSYPELGIADAREVANELRKLVRKGIDPVKHYAEARRKTELAETYTVRAKWLELKTIKEKDWAKRTVRCFAGGMNKHVFPVIEHLPYYDVHTTIVQGIFKKLEGTPVMAGHVFNNLNRTLNYCKLFNKEAGVEWENPLTGMKEFLITKIEHQHFKAQPFEDVPAFLREIHTYQDTHPLMRKTNHEANEAVKAARNAGVSWPKLAKKFNITEAGAYWRYYAKPLPLTVIHGRSVAAYALEFLMLTMPRSTEIQHALKAGVDFRKKTLTIPRADMKVTKERDNMPAVIPLVDRAIEILRIMETVNQGSDYIFPGQAKGRTLEDKEKRLNERPGVTGWPTHEGALRRFAKEKLGFTFDVHGFRTSFTDWADAENIRRRKLGMREFSKEAIEYCLDHETGNKVQRAYHRRRYMLLVEERRELLQLWYNHLLGLPPVGGEAPPDAEVIELFAVRA